MKYFTWISNGDPPIYVWHGSIWYNQRDKKYYIAYCPNHKDCQTKHWQEFDHSTGCSYPDKFIEMPKRTRTMGLK